MTDAHFLATFYNSRQVFVCADLNDTCFQFRLMYVDRRGLSLQKDFFLLKIKK